MSKRIEGEVFKVYSKEFRGKTNFTIKIDNDPIWYRAGTSRYAGIAEPGNRVEFDAEMNQDGTSARIVGDVKLAAPPKPAATPAPSYTGGDRQSSITYQSSRKDALEFVTIALSEGALTLPAAKAKKLGALEALLDRYTAQFFEDVNTLGAVTREAEGGGEAVSADDEAGDEDDGE